MFHEIEIYESTEAALLFLPGAKHKIHVPSNRRDADFIKGQEFVPRFTANAAKSLRRNTKEWVR